MKRLFILTIILGYVAFASAQSDRQFIRNGNRLFKSSNYPQAEVLYRKALVKNPSNTQALYNLGCALMMQKKDSAAVIQYQKSARLEKNKLRRSMAYHNIGVICQNHKMYAEAIKAYEQSLRDNPKDNETRYNLALCKRLQKKQNNKDKGKQNKKSKEKEKDNNSNNTNSQSGNNKKQPDKEQMSKDNAEQLLNAAIQNEKATQQRLEKSLRNQGKRSLQKNW